MLPYGCQGEVCSTVCDKVLIANAYCREAVGRATSKHQHKAEYGNKQDHLSGSVYTLLFEQN